MPLAIEAGQTSENDDLNFNGHSHGEATITVPVGVVVHVDFANDDPAVAHSLGPDRRVDDFPRVIARTQPVFPGAITTNPTSLEYGTRPGHAETLTFTADRPGRSSLICYMPGHTAAGKWIRFDVALLK